jgi:acyl-CoA synthetase (AMP-forming)/AMP-acid ligase II
MKIDKSNFEKSLIDIIDDAFERFSDRVCLQFRDESYTYAQVQEQSKRVAGALSASGFEKGMHAAIYSLNSAKAFILTLGIIRAGGVWIPVNPRNSQVDNVSVLGKMGCQAFFYQDSYAVTLPLVDEAVGGLALSVCIDDVAGNGGVDGWLECAPTAPVRVNHEATDIITIPMTGGTTGLPKGAMLSDRNFRALSYAICRDIYNGEDHKPVVLCAAPMTHVGGRIAVTSIAAGCRYVIKDVIDPQDILQTIQDEKVTDMFLPPTAIYGLLAQPNVREFDYSSLRQLGYGSAPISISQLKKAIEVFGPVMGGGFGQTECPMKVTEFPPQDHFIDGKIAPESRLRSVGRATVISEVAILDDDGIPLAAGERGEIGVKGGNVFEGYYNAPEETAKARKNGWHLTGDIGYMDDDGFLFIVDRKKDMIITGGFNVYSAEVEQSMGLLEGIACVAVIGVPSEKWGEEVKAIVQLVPGVEFTDEELMAVCKEKMGGVKAPKSIEFVSELPKTPLGKIDKKMIRKQYWKDVGRII